MKEYERQDTAARIAGAELPEELAADLDWCQEAGFTPLEARRLIFARWLYHEGVLTEYPRAGRRENSSSSA